MSTKWCCVEVRTVVWVGSEGGEGGNWMKARVEIEGGIVFGGAFAGGGKVKGCWSWVVLSFNC